MTTFNGTKTYSVVAPSSGVYNGSTSYSVTPPATGFIGTTAYEVVAPGAGAQAFKRVGSTLVAVRMGKRRGSVIDWLTP